MAKIPEHLYFPKAKNKTKKVVANPEPTAQWGEAAVTTVTAHDAYWSRWGQMFLGCQHLSFF